MKRFIILVLVGFILSCGINLWSADNSPAAIKAKKELSSNTSSTQIPFIRNEGQIQTPEVKFYTKVINGSVFITDKGEFVYNIITRKDYLGADDYIQSDGSLPLSAGFYYLKETPVRSRQIPSGEVTGLELSPTVVNFFLGDKPENWRTNIQTYKLITLGEVWEGITLNLKANQKNIEKLFIINPNGDVKSIQFSMENIKELSLSNSGELEVCRLGYDRSDENDSGINFTQPIAYQEIDGIRKNIEVSYRLINKTTYGFTVGNYDKSIPLVIDPILSSTYIGGTFPDVGQGVAVDSAGNIFVTGYSFSADYPVAGEGGSLPYNPTWSLGGYHIVVSKFNPTLSVLLASTFVGGSRPYEPTAPAEDRGFCIAIDNTVNQNVFVAGYTTCTDFPTATDKPNASAFDTSYNEYQERPVFPFPRNYEDACVIKLNNSLTRLLAGTYIGGRSTGVWDDPEQARDIAIDTFNNVFICGTINNGVLPADGRFPNNSGGRDAFVVKLNNNLSGWTPSDPSGFYFDGTFIGGFSNDEAFGVAIDYENNVFVCGYAISQNFPTTQEAYLNGRGGGGLSYAFVSKFNNNLSTLLASTFLGGTNGGEIATDIVVGRQGLNTVYVCGVTSSSINFPVTPNAYNSGNPPGNGVWDIFVSRFNNTLSTLINSTWIGGEQTDEAYSICQGSVNTDIYICGLTESGGYPTTDGCFGPINNGNTDGCISVFNETLSSLNASTYIGGSGTDIARCIRTDRNGNILITGQTTSGEGIPSYDSIGYPVWPISGTDTAFDISFNSNPGVTVYSDIFVTRITTDLFGGYTPLPPSPQESPKEIPTGSSGDPFAPSDAFTKELGSCFIATVVYGSPTHPNVMTLKNFRDKYLLTNTLGNKFVKWYYKVSPGIADYLKTSPFKASVVRIALTPFVYVIKYPTLILIAGLLLLLMVIRFKRIKDSVSA
ncbi:MAG: CFI-box-CTERM domain-containing protein [Planctomycetota bacterium]